MISLSKNDVKFVVCMSTSLLSIKCAEFFGVTLAGILLLLVGSIFLLAAIYFLIVGVLDTYRLWGELRKSAKELKALRKEIDQIEKT